jgi:hypothetical protein
MPTSDEYTQQRIHRDTKRKLKEISSVEGRATPQQLKIIIDREYAAHSELNSRPLTNPKEENND